MKHLFFSLFLLFATVGAVFGQVKKPKLLIVPSRTWCMQNNFMDVYTTSSGQEENIPNYQRAFDENADVSMVIGAMQDFMTKEGYKVEDLKGTLLKLKSRAARDNVTSAGGGLNQSPLDLLNKTAKGDINVEVFYAIKRDGPYKYVEFNVSAIDAYSNEPVSTGNIGRGSSASGTELVNQLEEAVLSFKDKFISDIDRYYNGLAQNGRHIVLRLTVANNSDINYEDNFGGDELNKLIEDWVADHAVKGNYSIEDKTENEIFFDEVRIPLVYTDANGRTRGATADSFGTELRKYIEAVTGRQCKLDVIGLGEVNIILGGKS